MKRVFVLFAGLLVSSLCHADHIKVAVASNFSDAARELARQFEQTSGHKVTLAFGSTGKHYAQIVHGAPFDLFLAADQRRPQKLEEQGKTIKGSRFVYAVGRLALWGDGDSVDELGEKLRMGRFKRLAIANPKLAPYGRAAQQFLTQQTLWEPLRSKLVYGENISQTLQFVHSGNAELGLVALSQLKRPKHSVSGFYWLVPDSEHKPIVQQAVLLKEKTAARAFWRYLQTSEAKALIESFGYDVSPDNN